MCDILMWQSFLLLALKGGKVKELAAENCPRNKELVAFIKMCTHFFSSLPYYFSVQDL